MTSRTIPRDSGHGSTPAAARTPLPQAGGPGPGQAERLAYSVGEAARLTGLSRDLLYYEMQRGNLAYLKVGRRHPITRRTLSSSLASPPNAGGLRGTAAITRRDGPGAPY